MGVDGVFRAADFLGKAHLLWNTDKGSDVLDGRREGIYFIGILP